MTHRNLAVGDHVRVANAYWDASIRGATGIITEPSDHIRASIPPGAFWVEFDEWIPANNPAHPIEAAAVEASGLDLIP